MNEDRNTRTAAAAEEAVDSIRKLLDAVGNDEALRKKLEDALSALTGKTAEAKAEPEDAGQEEPEKESSSAKEEDSSAEEESDGEEDEEEDENGSEDIVSSGTDLSDIFTEDALAGMVVGFVAGAAVVGGGVLLHKLLKD